MSQSLRVLIGCATSCVALDAFLARGHDAWQCDLLPADKPTNRHIQGDVRDHLGDGWDLLLVCNPPCTRLCNSGVRWLHERNLWADLDEAVALFSACWRAPVPRVALENPVMHRHARERMPADLPRPQIVQPWHFGDAAFKATGLYTRGEFVTMTVDGAEFVVVDIGMRMLTPRELFNAQGFPPDYQIEGHWIERDGDWHWKPFAKDVQISCCGNSVCPDLARAIVGANCTHLIAKELAA